MLENPCDETAEVRSEAKIGSCVMIRKEKAKQITVELSPYSISSGNCSCTDLSPVRFTGTTDS